MMEDHRSQSQYYHIYGTIVDIDGFGRIKIDHHTALVDVGLGVHIDHHAALVDIDWRVHVYYHAALVHVYRLVHLHVHCALVYVDGHVALV